MRTPTTALLSRLAAQEPVPPFVLAEPRGMDGPQSTIRVQRLLRIAHRRDHVSMRKAFLHVAGPFPVAGPASWSNDWHAFRPCPYPHLHEGLDIFAPWGTPVVAVVNGVLNSKGVSSMSGLFVEITNASGTKFFYCHLSRFAAVHTGQRVRRGQVLGYIGTTGDARGTTPHLHFQVEPGGIPTPPKPFVDRWLLREIGRARAMDARTAPPRAIGAHPLP